MSLKMATLCLDASLDMLWPLCCHRTLCLQADLCRCLPKGPPQALQAVVTLSACHVIQNNPQFIVQGFEVCTPQKPILSAHEGQKVPPQPLLSCLSLLGRNWVLLEDPFLTTEEGHVKMFHNSLYHILLITLDTSFTSFLQKWRCCNRTYAKT